MFVYVKNHTGDDDLVNRLGEIVYPVSWFWERIVETTDQYVYLSLGMMFGFIA